MQRKSFKDNAISLAIGCIIGAAIALSTQTPIIHDCTERISTKLELLKISEDISRMNLPESNANHGDTLEEVIYGIKDEVYEYAAVFYGPYKLLEITNFDSNSVYYEYSYSSQINPRLIKVHNHPNSEHDMFSYGDLYNTICDDSIIEAIVVTSHIKHSLAAPDGWPSPNEFMEYLNDRIGTHFGSEGYLDYERALAMEEAGYIVLTGPDDDYVVSIDFTPKLISELAGHFGLIYEAELLE